MGLIPLDYDVIKQAENLTNRPKMSTFINILDRSIIYIVNIENLTRLINYGITDGKWYSRKMALDKVYGMCHTNEVKGKIAE